MKPYGKQIYSHQVTQKYETHESIYKIENANKYESHTMLPSNLALYLKVKRKRISKKIAKEDRQNNVSIEYETLR
jgi:thymidylate kinase